MMISVKNLFVVGISHSYYQGVCRDFSFTIPSDTARTLGNGRLLARVIDDQLIVAYEVNAAGNGPVVDLTDRRLRFGLRLTNVDFGNFTALSPVPAGSIHVYQNATTASAFDAPATPRLVTAIFSHPLSGSTRPATVSVTRDGATVQTDTVRAGRDTATFDLRGVAPGRIDVHEVFAGGTTHISNYYLDAESQQDRVFAIVEVDIAAGFYTSPPTLPIAFDAKEETLKYYVVVTNYSNADVATLSVKDAGFLQEGRPEIVFSKVLPAAFTVGELPASMLAGSGSSLLLFKSQAPVRRRAVGRRKLQLKKGNDAMIAELPQPGPSATTADVIVHLKRPT